MLRLLVEMGRGSLLAHAPSMVQIEFAEHPGPPFASSGMTGRRIPAISALSSDHATEDNDSDNDDHEPTSTSESGADASFLQTADSAAGVSAADTSAADTSATEASANQLSLFPAALSPHGPASFLEESDAELLKKEQEAVALLDPKQASCALHGGEALGVEAWPLVHAAFSKTNIDESYGKRGADESAVVVDATKELGREVLPAVLERCVGELLRTQVEEGQDVEFLLEIGAGEVDVKGEEQVQQDHQIVQEGKAGTADVARREEGHGGKTAGEAEERIGGRGVAGEDAGGSWLEEGGRLSVVGAVREGRQSKVFRIDRTAHFAHALGILLSLRVKPEEETFL